MKGRIYKIINGLTNDVYVGSSFQELRYRFRKHKDNYKSWLKSGKDSKKGMSIYPYFEMHGIKNFKIILIKEYEVVDKRHLEAYEQLWINKLKPINKQSSFKISWLWNKEYREKNKEKIQKYMKSYSKEYREKNKEQIREKKSEVINCECGYTYTRTHKTRHQRTEKHKKAMQKKINILHIIIFFCLLTFCEDQFLVF